MSSPYYPPPPPVQQPVQQRNDHGGLAVASLTLGVIGAAFSLIPIMFWLAWILGVLALIFGLVGRRRGMGKAGIVLAGIAIVVGCIGLHIVIDASHQLDHDLNCVSRSVDNDTTNDCPTS